jgi:hypothetical protein
LPCSTTKDLLSIKGACAELGASRLFIHPFPFLNPKSKTGNHKIVSFDHFISKPCGERSRTIANPKFI